MSKYPTWVCQACALANGGRIIPGHPSTIHKGTCDLCKKTTEVTEPRDYGHLTVGKPLKAAKELNWAAIGKSFASRSDRGYTITVDVKTLWPADFTALRVQVLELRRRDRAKKTARGQK